MLNLSEATTTTQLHPNGQSRIKQTADIVFVDDNKPVTTSELVAKFFDKRHSNTLREIKDLIVLINFVDQNLSFAIKIMSYITANQTHHIALLVMALCCYVWATLVRNKMR